MVKTKKVVIRRKGKFFNTITKRYVSKATAHRYNAFYRKHPKGLHTSAYGNYRYKPKKKYTEQTEKLKKLIYKPNQVIRTKDRTGKTVYFSPFEREILKSDVAKKLGKMDYTICDEAVKVKLYRLTRDRNHVYHVFTWYIDSIFQLQEGIEIWLEKVGKPIMECILNEVYDQSKKNKLDPLQVAYGHFQVQFYSDIDSYPASRTFGFLKPTLKGLDQLGREFNSMVNDYSHKLATASYHRCYFNRLSIYLYAMRNPYNIMFSKYRSGVLNI